MSERGNQRIELSSITVSATGTQTTVPVTVQDFNAFAVYLNVTGLNIVAANGQAIRIYVQTSYDGSVWSDIANVAYTTDASNATRREAVWSSHPRGSNLRVSNTDFANDGALADNTVATNFPAGQYLRLKVVASATTGSPSATIAPLVLTYCY